MTKKKISKKITPINPKHKQFVEEYLLEWNATRAYKAVYGTKKDNAAAVSAAQLLRKPKVKEYLTIRVAERNEELKIDQKFVIAKAKEIIAADYIGTFQYLTQEEIDDMPLDKRRLVQDISVKKIKTNFSRGGVEQDIEEVTYKVKFMSKDRAHEMLAKHTGSYEKDNVRDINLTGFVGMLKDLDI